MLHERCPSARAKHSTVRSVLLAACVFLAPIPAVLAAQRIVLEEFRVPPPVDLIPVQLQIGEMLHRFVLDTGASADAYDSSLRTLLGEPVDAGDFYSPAPPLDFYWGPDALLGDLRVNRATPVACVDLSPMRDVIGEDYWGVLGMATLEHYILVIEYDRGRAQLLAPGSPLIFRSEYDCPLLRGSAGRYLIEMEVAPGYSRKFLIDTGQDGGGSLSSGLCDTLLDRGSGLTVIGSGEILGLYGASEARELLAETVRLGPFTHSRYRFNESETNAIGRDFLCRYDLVLDFPDRRAYFRRSSRHDLPGRYDPPGLELEPGQAGFRVTDIAPGGIADVSGIGIGDTITAVDGVAVAGVQLGQVLDALRVRRGRARSVEIELGPRGVLAARTVWLDARLDEPR